jgi:hypothetical protein
MVVELLLLLAAPEAFEATFSDGELSITPVLVVGSGNSEFAARFEPAGKEQRV